MLRKLSVPFLTLAFASYLWAFQKEPQPGELPYEIQGVIASANNVGNDLTIHTNSGQNETFAADADTTIRVNGKKARIADLRVGEKASIEVEGQRALQVDVSDASNSSAHR